MPMLVLLIVAIAVALAIVLARQTGKDPALFAVVTLVAVVVVLLLQDRVDI